MPDKSVKRAHPKRVAGALAVTIDRAEEKLHIKHGSRHSAKSSTSSSSRHRSTTESGGSTPASIPTSPNIHSPLSWSGHSYNGAEPSPITPNYSSSSFSPRPHGSHDNVPQYAYAPSHQHGASNIVPGSALARLEFPENASYSDAGFREEAERREKLRWLSSGSSSKSGDKASRGDKRPESPSWQPSFDTDVSSASRRSEDRRPLALRSHEKDGRVSHKHSPSSSRPTLSARRSSKRSHRQGHSNSTSSHGSGPRHSDSAESLPNVVIDADSQLKSSLAALRLDDEQDRRSRKTSWLGEDETSGKESVKSKHHSATTPTRPAPPQKQHTAVRIPTIRTTQAPQERSHKSSHSKTGAGSSSESTSAVEPTRRAFSRRMSAVYSDSERRCSLSPTLVRTNSRIMFTVEERSPAAFPTSNPMEAVDFGARTPPDTPITPCAGDAVGEVQIAWCPDSRAFPTALKTSSRRN